MSKISKSPVPLRLKTGAKRDVRAQVAALCYRIKNDELQVCLITARETGRWIIPRGWPMHKQTPAQSAAIEAIEEAGVEGRVHPMSIGAYSYEKPIDGVKTPIMVSVFAIELTKKHKSWPERADRKRKWMTTKKAAKKLSDPGLQQIVANFDPALLDIARKR